jgi:Ras-related protein Rab-21
MSVVPFKIVLLGEGRVGKTCLTLRYVQNTFSDKQESTIQATYLDRRLNVGKQSVKLMIWDTAGQERFHALGPIYYRDANGALLVYDITDRDSFTKVRHWVKELRKIVGDSIVIVIAGNKADLEKRRQVESGEAEEYAATVGAIHMLVSAKTGRGVEEGFLELTKGMLKHHRGAAGGGGGGAGGGGGIAGAKNKRNVVEISHEEPVKQGGCC